MHVAPETTPKFTKTQIKINHNAGGQKNKMQSSHSATELQPLKVGAERTIDENSLLVSSFVWFPYS